MQRGTEVSTQANVASATNPGGSWQITDKDRTKGHAVYGPCEDPMHQEARDANFADIVTLPIMPEPIASEQPQWTIPQIITMGPNGFYQIKDRVLGWWRWAMNTNYNGEKWYHESRKRIPGLWQCETNDLTCLYEAEMQFKHDREVDRMVLQVLEDRLRGCWMAQGATWNTRDWNVEKCNELAMFKRQADMNYSTKYRNIMPWGVQSVKALMKQKNRFIERRWLSRQGRSYDELQNMMHEPISQAMMWDMMKWA